MGGRTVMGRKNLAWLTCLVRCHGFGNDRDCMPPSTRASGVPSRTLLLPSIPCYQASATQRCQSQLHRVKVGDHERCPLGAGSWVQATCTDNGVRSQPDSAPKTSPNQDRGGPFRGGPESLHSLSRFTEIRTWKSTPAES